MPDSFTYNPSANISVLHSELTHSGKDTFGEEWDDFYKKASRSYNKQMQNPGGNDASNKYSWEVSHCHFSYPRVLGQFQLNDSISQSSSVNLRQNQVSFKGLLDRSWEADKAVV